MPLGSGFYLLLEYVTKRIKPPNRSVRLTPTLKYANLPSQLVTFQTLLSCERVQGVDMNQPDCRL